MMMNNDLYNTRQENDVNVIDVNVDSFDHRFIDDFKQAINGCLTSKKEVLLNLETVNFMDSAGLGVILYGHRACAQAGGKFAVCQAHGYVNKLFSLTGVNKAVTVYNSEQEALNK
jgi:stage II sporulation protein AA (anti-sigma F factor antagonist)